MKKLKLDLDDLRVDSFDTTPTAGASERGTVFGQYLETAPRWCATDGDTCDTCGGSCDGTLGNQPPHIGAIWRWVKAK